MDNNMITYGGNAAPAPASVGAEMVVSRQAQEVQAAMVVAKRFPRDEDASLGRILRSCKRETLAKTALYEFPRGGESVTGPSIRLAEVIAQNWGNIDSGIVELEQKPGESTVMAYCWDLETNTRESKIFTVPHIRQTKKGQIALTDPRDIYELIANQGSRRKRACILSVIPGDVVEAATDACRRTLMEGKEALATRIEKMLDAYAAIGIPKEAIEKRMGCNASAFTAQTIVSLGNIYNSIKDGRAPAESYFEIPAKAPDKAPAQPQQEEGELPFTVGDAQQEPAQKAARKPKKGNTVNLDEL